MFLFFNSIIIMVHNFKGISIFGFNVDFIPALPNSVLQKHFDHVNVVLSHSPVQRCEPHVIKLIAAVPHFNDLFIEPRLMIICVNVFIIILANFQEIFRLFICLRQNIVNLFTVTTFNILKKFHNFIIATFKRCSWNNLKNMSFLFINTHHIDKICTPNKPFSNLQIPLTFPNDDLISHVIKPLELV